MVIALFKRIGIRFWESVFIENTGPVLSFLHKIPIHIVLFVVLLNDVSGLTLELFWLQPFRCIRPQYTQAGSPFHTHLIFMACRFRFHIFQTLNVLGKVRESLQLQLLRAAWLIDCIRQVLLQSVRPLVQNDRSTKDALFTCSLLSAGDWKLIWFPKTLAAFRAR